MQTLLITDTDWCFDLTNLYHCSSHYLYPQFCFHIGMGKVLNLQGPSWVAFYPHSKSLPRRAPALLERLHAVLPESVRPELPCAAKEKQSQCHEAGGWGPLPVSSSGIQKGFSHIDIWTSLCWNTRLFLAPRLGRIKLRRCWVWSLTLEFIILPYYKLTRYELFLSRGSELKWCLFKAI